MKRLVLVLVLLMLPLQATRAAISAYCSHENGVSSQHFGHHLHKHRASSSESSGDTSRTAGGSDSDCGFCHLNLKPVHSAPFTPQAETGLQAGALPEDDLYSSFVPPGPERPKWYVPA